MMARQANRTVPIFVMAKVGRDYGRTMRMSAGIGQERTPMRTS